MKKSFLNEDWLAVIVGFLLIAGSAGVFQFAMPRFGWAHAADLPQLISGPNPQSLLLLYLAVLFVGVTTWMLGGKKTQMLAVGISFLFLVSLVAQVLAGFKLFKDIGLEYVIFGLLLGILLRAVAGVPAWLKESLQSEFFIKTGLVLLGTSIIFRDLVKSGSLGLIQALVVVVVVWYFAFWLAKKFKIDEELSLMISSAVSICGVSAAIATCGAIQGDGKKLSYVVSLVLLVALPMMILMPMLSSYLGLSPALAGAWIGGTIDTTGAVVATGAQLGEEALNVSTIVKLSQNVLLGIAAVAISFFWMVRKKTGEGSRPDWKLIWERFPKFVLGFLGASFIYSFVMTPETIVATKDFIKGMQTALFAIAFVSIGLETDLSMLVKTGNGRPAAVFILAQAFNVLFTLGIAWVLFR